MLSSNIARSLFRIQFYLIYFLIVQTDICVDDHCKEITFKWAEHHHASSDAPPVPKGTVASLHFKIVIMNMFL